MCAPDPMTCHLMMIDPTCDVRWRRSQRHPKYLFRNRRAIGLQLKRSILTSCMRCDRRECSCRAGQDGRRAEEPTTRCAPRRRRRGVGFRSSRSSAIVVMTAKEQGGPDVLDADPSDVIWQFIVEYLQQNTPEGTLEEVYRVAEKSRSVRTEAGVAAWTPYLRRRSLLEAAGVVLGGGPDALREVGRCVFNSIRRPERMEIFQALGSPAAVYEALPGFIELYRTGVLHEDGHDRPDECRIEIQMREPRAVPRDLRVRPLPRFHRAATLRVLGGRDRS